MFNLTVLEKWAKLSMQVIYRIPCIYWNALIVPLVRNVLVIIAYEIMLNSAFFRHSDLDLIDLNLLCIA